MCNNNKEPCYIKIYPDAVLGPEGISNGRLPLFLELASRMVRCDESVCRYGQMVCTSGKAGDDIKEALGWTSQCALQQGLRALCDQGSIRRVDRGKYGINPDYARIGEREE